MYPFAAKPKQKIVTFLAKGLFVALVAFALFAYISFLLRPQFSQFDQAKNLIRAGKAARAVPILEDLARKKPQDTMVLPWLARGYLSCDRIVEGRLTLDKAIALKVPPDEITQAVLAYSSFYQGNGDFTRAESLLDWAKPYCLSGDVQLAKAKLYLDWANQCEQVGNTEEAIEKLELAHNLIPQITSDKSIVDPQSYATAISRRLSETLQRQAALFETRKKSNLQAIACLKKSLSLSDQPSIRLQLADLYKQNGQRQEAISHLRHVIKSDANNLSAKHALIEILVETKNLPGAKGALQELIRNEVSADNYLALARIETRLGNYSQAVSALEEANTLRQNDLVLLKNLESVLIKWADAIAARGNLKECVAIKARAAKVQTQVADIESGMAKKLGQVPPKPGQAHKAAMPDGKAATDAKLLIDQNNSLGPSVGPSIDQLKIPIAPQVPVSQTSVKESIKDNPKDPVKIHSDD